MYQVPSSLPAEELLGAIIESSDDAIVSKNLDGIITSWNHSAEKIFGYSRQEMVGQPIARLLPLSRPNEEKQILERIRRGERIDHFETQRVRKDGQLIDVSVTISPIRSKDGVVVGASKVARDITDQKRSANAANLLAAIVTSSEDAIISKDLTGKITSWNEAAERMYGYTAAEIVGQSVLLLVPEDRHEEEPEILSKISRGERLVHFETIRRHKSGKLIPVSLTISPIRESSGRVVGASKIVRDITEMKRIAADRDQLLESERVARTQAEQASRMKDDFLSTVSHELRTPLNAIVGWTHVLKESGLTPDVQEGVETIERNAQAQAQLINLLDLGRISSGKMMLDVHPVDLAEVIRDAIDSVRHSADNKKVGLQMVLNNARGTLMGDKNRLQQVFWNLIANAIKFTPKGGRVVITAGRVNSHVEVSVSDNGIGISSEFLPHIFERFRQADPSITRRAGGLGIGLTLVKQIVELHGGQVRAESPGAGQGSTFTVALPIVAMRLEKFSAADEPASKVPAEEDLRGITILAVDDDHDSLEVLRRILVTRQASVLTAGSVEEALELFRTTAPHIVISDIGMPGGDGYELIRKIRALPGGASVPAAALTALARTKDRMRALTAGFQTHLPKPVAPGELVAVVKSLAAIRR